MTSALYLEHYLDGRVAFKLLIWKCVNVAHKRFCDIFLCVLCCVCNNNKNNISFINNYGLMNGNLLFSVNCMVFKESLPICYSTFEGQKWNLVFNSCRSLKVTILCLLTVPPDDPIQLQWWSWQLLSIVTFLNM